MVRVRPRRRGDVHANSQVRRPYRWAMAWWRRSRRAARRGPSDGPNMAVDQQAVRRHLADFAGSRRGVEAYVEPGTNVTATTVILIAHDGEWTRRAAGTRQAAFELAAEPRGARSTTCSRPATRTGCASGTRASARRSDAYAAWSPRPGSSTAVARNPLVRGRRGARVERPAGTGPARHRRAGGTMAKSGAKSGGQGPSEDVKRKFREALDKKQSHAGQRRVRRHRARQGRPRAAAPRPTPRSRCSAARAAADAPGPTPTARPVRSDGPRLLVCPGSRRWAASAGVALDEREQGADAVARWRPWGCSPTAPPSLKDGPAMSTCAHGVPSVTNSLEEQPGGEHPAPALALVGEVGDRRVELAAQVVRQGHRPGGLAGGVGGGARPGRGRRRRWP